MTDRKGHLGILDVLLALAKNGASKENITIAIPDIAEIMGVSTGELTGSVNRLISSNYLDGNINQNVGQIRISAKGESILRQAMVDLQSMFYGFPTQLRGVLFSGLSEGKYYVSLKGYSSQFQKILGWKPYPGTLNLKLQTPEDIDGFLRLRNAPSHLIEKFEEGGRTFGEVLLWHCEITSGSESETLGAVIHPVRTHHNPSDVMECIAPVSLRERYSLRDGDVIVVRPAFR